MSIIKKTIENEYEVHYLKSIGIKMDTTNKEEIKTTSLNTLSVHYKDKVIYLDKEEWLIIREAIKELTMEQAIKLLFNE